MVKNAPNKLPNIYRMPVSKMLFTLREVHQAGTIKPGLQQILIADLLISKKVIFTIRISITYGSCCYNIKTGLRFKAISILFFKTWLHRLWRPRCIGGLYAQ